MYRIESISKEHWLFLSCDSSFDEPEGFVALLKQYQHQLGGKIVSVSQDYQYAIEGDPLHLVFQWDRCFGITIVVPTNIDLSTAKKHVDMLCERKRKT
jgi:hypothetical protein